MRYSQVILFFTLVAIVAPAFAFHYEDCGSTAGKLLTVSIPACGKGPRCILKKNTNISLEIDFNALEQATEVKAIVHGVLGGLSIPFRFSHGDACKYGGLQCPLNKGSTYTYKATLPILKVYPVISIDVKWELENEKEEDIVCILIPAKIVN